MREKYPNNRMTWTVPEWYLEEAHHYPAKPRVMTLGEWIDNREEDDVAFYVHFWGTPDEPIPAGSTRVLRAEKLIGGVMVELASEPHSHWKTVSEDRPLFVYKESDWA